jgi:hypothetical protein
MLYHCTRNQDKNMLKGKTTREQTLLSREQIGGVEEGEER